MACCSIGNLNRLNLTGFSGKNRNSEKQEGKRQQELAVDMSHQASWDEAWKRYAARVFHNWSKEARDLGGTRSVYWGFSLGEGSPNGLRLQGVSGG
jgi:hypothetical protein